MTKDIRTPPPNNKALHSLPNGGSVAKMDWAWRQHITASEKMILLYVTSKMGMSEEIKLNFTRLEEFCGLTRDQSMEALNRLLGRGLTEVEVTKDGEETYVLFMPRFWIRGSL